MKKRLALLLALTLTGSMVACSSTSTTSTVSEAPVQSESSTAADASEVAPSETTEGGEAVAETAYPERPINNVIPFGAGGGTDVWNRALMEAMSGELGTTIVSSNMTGGSAGSIGVDYVWQANHDGYTLCGTSETPLTIPVMTALEQTSKDWKIFIAAGSPGLLCINKNSQYKTLQEVIDALTAAPESVSIAGTTGGLWFALAKLFDSYGNVPFKWVPYDGSAGAIKGAVSNEADCVVASAGEVKDFVRSGDLIPLAVMNTESWEFPEFGTIPAVTDTVPDLAQYLPLSQYLGFQVPADTDPAIVAKLEAAFHTAMQSDAIKQFAADQLCTIYDLTGDDAAAMAAGIESKLCWILYDMGQTKYSPEEFGISKP